MTPAPEAPWSLVLAVAAALTLAVVAAGIFARGWWP